MTREREIELLATVLEYEHALHHVVQVDHHHPAACTGCQTLCQSALDGVNRADFTEMATGSVEDREGR